VEIFDEAGRWLVGQGILGIVVLGLAYAYWSARSRIDQAHSERLADFKATLETIHANNTAISQVVEATRARTEASASMAKAQEMLAAEYARSAAEIERLREVVEALKHEVGRQREELALARQREEMVRRGTT
jgi:hypothetical protein